MIPAGGSPSAEGVVAKAPLEVVATPLKVVMAGSRRLRMPDQLLLSSYVPPKDRVHPLANTVAPGPKGSREIIDRWSPFNKRESSITHIRDLYPTLLRVSMSTRAE